MVEPEASRFGHAALQSGLIDAPGLRACWNAISEEKRTADAIDRRLARQAVESGKLTLWQAQQLLAGRSNGFKIDKYVLLDRIGQGGMGRVYLAKDTRLNRRVALKILAPERMNNPRSITRFQREAKLGAQLQHENLVRMYDEGEAQGIRYLVMEYIEGKTVGQLIGEQGTLPPPVAADIARQVALGLEHACQKGLIHRDVNPWNILITAEGMAKLTDMGLAIDPTDQQDNVTRDGATVGTFDYIAPEQARHSRSVDTRADIYALGCTLYHMLSGRVPFPTPSLPEKLYAHQLTDPEPLTALVPGMPPELDETVQRMMKKNPADRFARPVEVAQAMGTFVTGTTPDRPSLVTGWSAVKAPGQPASVTAQALASSAWGPSSEIRNDGGTTVATPASPPVEHQGGSGSIFPDLDLGPEPPLIESRSSSVAPRTSTSMTLAPRPFRVGIGLLMGAVGVLCLLFVLFRDGLIGGGQTAATIGEKGASGFWPIEVRGVADGTNLPVATLSEAVAKSGGRPGCPILIGKDDGPVVSRGTLVLARGRFVIQPQAEGPPRGLLFDLSGQGNVPALQTRDGSLTIERLTIIVDYGQGGRRGGDMPAAFDVAGNLVLRNCHLIARGRHAGLRAIESRGGRVELDGCVLEGFDGAAIDLHAAPEGEALIKNCLFVPPRTDGRQPGWAVRVTRAKSSEKGGPPRLTLERCTVLGQGAFSIDGFTANDPLIVATRGNVFRTVHLLMAPTSDFPNALQWAGAKNVYQVQKSWGVAPPSGLDELPGASDLASWRKTFADQDDDSRTQALTLPADKVPASGPLLPSNYVPTEFAGAIDEGIDPEKLGPPTSSSGEPKDVERQG